MSPIDVLRVQPRRFTSSPAVALLERAGGRSLDTVASTAGTTHTPAPHSAQPTAPAPQPGTPLQSSARGPQPGTSAQSSAPGPSPASSNRRLSGNPLFRDGVNLDEFGVDATNVDFAVRHFGLDPKFADLAKANIDNVRLSVLYHSDGKGVQVDAYRAAATAGKKSVFAVYKAVDPRFDPASIYKNEIVTPLDNGTLFATELVSPRLAVPSSAGSDVTQWLGDNGFSKQESVAFGDCKYPADFGKFFGLDDKLSIDLYDPQKQSFAQKFKIYAQLCKSSPDFGFMQIGNVANNIGSAMLLGVLTPELWKQGTLYGIASTISSIDNIASPALGILGEGLLGSVVDRAVNSDHPLDNLKKVSLAVAGVNAVEIGCAAALHPAILTTLSTHPAGLFLGLYGAQTILGAMTGGVSDKASTAIHDQLINKQAPGDADYARNFYQIIGVEASISRGIYMGAYSAAVAAATAMPALSLPIALGGAALWAGSNFIWPLYHQKPEIKTTIEGKGFVHEGDRYTFDSGWEVEFRGGQGKIVKEDATHFSVSMDDGALYVKSDNPQAPTVSHTRRWKDYLPRLLKPKFTGEKERWALDNGGKQITVSRNGNSGYTVTQPTDHEFVISRGDNPFHP